MNYEEIQRLIEQNRQEIGKREADIPGIYNKYSPSTDPEIAAARAAQADKVRQLFNHDSRLAQTKFQPSAAPGSTVTGAPPETPPEMILDPLIGLKAANTQTMSTANEAIDIGENIAKRKDVLAESLDKALKLFQVGLEIKKAEQAALQDEFTNLLNLDKLSLDRETKNKDKEGKVALGDLLNNVLKWQQTKEEATPTITGKTISKGQAGINAIKKMMSEKYPGQEVDYTQNADGTYNWAVRKSNQAFMTPEQAQTYKNPNQTLAQLLSAFTSKYPEESGSAATILEGFASSKDTNFGTTADEYAAGVAGQPRTPENEARYQKWIQWKNLSDLERNNYKGDFNTFFSQTAGVSELGPLNSTIESAQASDLDPLKIR